MNVSSPLKMIALAVGVFAVGIAGVLVGNTLRQTVRSDAYVAVDPTATTLLREGMTFPDADTHGPTGARRTAEMIGADGTVFLFLDLECPPCVDMAAKWQGVLDGGAFPGLDVVGVTNQDADAADAFRREHALSFPIVQDTKNVYLGEWRVQRFPLEVLVGADGRIRSLSFDSVSPIDLPRLAERLKG